MTAGQIRRQHNDEERREMDSFARRHRTSFSGDTAEPVAMQSTAGPGPSSSAAGTVRTTPGRTSTSSAGAPRVYPTIDPIRYEEHQHARES